MFSRPKMWIVSVYLLWMVMHAVGSTAFVPHSIPFDALVDQGTFEAGEYDSILKRALTETGIISISDVPGFGDLQPSVLRSAHLCSKESQSAKTHTFEDGTLRRTIAAGTSAGHVTDFELGEGVHCDALREAGATFRQTVAKASQEFARRLDSVFAISGKPLLEREDQTAVYRSLGALVMSGEQLEHFHSYQAPEKLPEGATKATVDLHTDSGLFIAFTPAMMLEENGAQLAPGAADGKFYILLRDGSQVLVDFTEAKTSLIFMLGDAMARYVNPHISSTLRATPHALVMPHGFGSTARTWYGRMMLPPAAAVSPEHGISFGKIRSLTQEALNGASDEKAADVLHLGCSQDSAFSKFTVQEQADCASNQLYCWSRCMDYTATASPEYCASQNMGFNCTNQWDELKDPSKHGDYWPSCTNSTTYEGTYSPIPAPTGDCANTWDSFVKWDSYTHQVELRAGQTWLLWNVVGSSIQAKMVHHKRVGWMALGAENIGGKRNGMNGAPIIMGLRDLNGSAYVQEFRIHDSLSGWRWWNTPLTSQATATSMTVSECFSAMEFTTTAFGDRVLNLTENNRLIWANSRQSFVTSDFAPYHGDETASFMNREDHRGKISLDGFSNDTYLEVAADSPSPSPTSSGAVGQTLACSALMLWGFLLWSQY